MAWSSREFSFQLPAIRNTEIQDGTLLVALADSSLHLRDTTCSLKRHMCCTETSKRNFPPAFNRYLLIICSSLQQECGRDSSVGIATRYRLDGPGIESRWG